MVYGIIGMINFAHGDIYMVGAFISLVGFLLMAALGITSRAARAIALVLLVTVAFTAALWLDGRAHRLSPAARRARGWRR